MFATYKVRANIVLVATIAPTVGEFVAAGLGVSLVHPLMVSGLRERLAARRFEPEIPFDFQLCRSRDTRNARLVEDFLQEARIVAERISRDLLPLKEEKVRGRRAHLARNLSGL
jgi:DNA-binding transcriptional LysR family regulator